MSRVFLRVVILISSGLSQMVHAQDSISLDRRIDCTIQLAHLNGAASALRQTGFDIPFDFIEKTGQLYKLWTESTMVALAEAATSEALTELEMNGYISQLENAGEGGTALFQMHGPKGMLDLLTERVKECLPAMGGLAE